MRSHPLRGAALVGRLVGLLATALLLSPTAASADAATDTACAIPRAGHPAPSFRTAHPRVLLGHAATLACLQARMTSGVPAATRFKALVDNEVGRSQQAGYVWGSPVNYGFQYWYGALMFRVSGQASYADFAISGVDAIVAAEEARIAANQNPEVAGDSYLYIGEIVGDIALVYDWAYDRLTPTQRSRWLAFMNQAVWNVWHPDDANWAGRAAPWSGWSVDNPSNNYYYSFLRATMLLGLASRGENAQAQGWIDQFRQAKIASQLVPTFTRDLAGGGSREGTGYGVAMRGLFELYDLWERSTGERIADLTPHAVESAAWMTHAIVPTLTRIAAVGDHARDSTASLFDYHRDYLLRLINLFPQDRISAVAASLLAGSSVPRMSSSFQYVVDYLYAPPPLPDPALSEFGTTYRGTGTGQLFMRSAWGDPAAAYALFSCGPYTESHAHQDQGAFQLFRGEWLAPTGNIYSHSGIQQSTAFNNLVRIASGAGTPVQQRAESAPCELKALADTSQYTYASADVTPVYDGQPSVQQVQREFLFIKPSTLVVFDRVTSTTGTQRTWTLNLPGTPSVVGDHLTFTGTSSPSNRLDVHRVAPAGLSYAVSPLQFDDGDWADDPAARRVDVTDTAGTQSRFLHVLAATTSGLPGVSGVTRSDAAGQTGVAFTLSDGRTVTARFGNGAPGATLEIKSAGGATQTTGALPSTVTTPPRFSTPDPLVSTVEDPPTSEEGSGTPSATSPATSGTPDSSAPTGAAPGGAQPLSTPVLPVLRGKRLTLAGVIVAPRKPGKCPKTATLRVTTPSGRALLRLSVRLNAATGGCVVATKSVTLPRRVRSVRVRLSGQLLQVATWTVRRS